MQPKWMTSIEEIVGQRHVLTQPEALATYAQDGYTLSREVPLAVVLPGFTSEVQAVMKVLSRHGVPVVARGAGTSLSGGAIPVAGSVVLHFSRMRQIHHIDWENRLVEVDPGVVNQDISRAVASEGFFYAPDPSSQRVCTIGGNFAENSGGPHCLKYGVTVNHIVMADIVLANGNLRRLGNSTADPDGPDWLGLLIGSEGTLGIATRLWLRITQRPIDSTTVLALFDHIDEASYAVSEIIAAGIIPAAMEMMDGLTISAVERGAYPVGYPTDLAAVLLIELDGEPGLTEYETQETLHRLALRQVRQVVKAQNATETNLWWANRKTAFGAMGLISPRYYVQDGVIPRHVLPDALKTIRTISQDYGIRIANVFHAGDGNLHPLLLYDNHDKSEVERVKQAGSDILDYCISRGGSITGEHGIGLEKISEMASQFNRQELAAQRAIKDAFDPTQLLNPGKLLPMPGRCIDYAN